MHEPGRKTEDQYWLVFQYVLGNLLWKYLNYKISFFKGCKPLSEALKKVLEINRTFHLWLISEYYLGFIAFTMIFSFQSVTVLGLSARSKPSPVSLSK